MIRWILQGFEEGIGGFDGHGVGLINEAYLMGADQGAVDDEVFQMADLVDFDLGTLFLTILRFNEKKVRVRMQFNLMTGPAFPAGIFEGGLQRGFAMQKFGKGHSDQPFPDLSFTLKQVGVPQMMGADCSLKPTDGSVMSLNGSKRHRHSQKILAVQSCRKRGLLSRELPNQAENSI